MQRRDRPQGHRHFRSRFTTIACTGLLLVGCATLASASDPVRLRLTDGSTFSDVDDFAITPDGNHVVYTHDPTVDEAYELYRVPTAGGAPLRLSGLLPSGSSVDSFTVTPDSSRVIYLAPQETVGVDELYTVPIDGGTPLKLNATLPSGGTVYSYTLSPDGTRVIYVADQETAGVDELYSVPSTGGTPIKLNGDLVSGGDVKSSALAHLCSPDSSRVTYLADQKTDEEWELFSVPITGGAPVQLNGALVANGDVSWQKISPDSSRVVYIADQQTNGVRELYSVPIGGGVAAKVNGPLITWQSVDAFLISPDSSTVVYRTSDASDDSYLFSAPIVGGDWEQLSESPGWSYGVGGFQISPDSSRVVYESDQREIYTYELFSVPISGGSSVRLNGSLVEDGWVFDFKISPDGSWVVYRADQMVDGYITGHRAPLAGPAGQDEPIWQQPNVLSGTDYLVAPSSEYLIVLGNRVLADGIERLWKVRLSGIPAPLGEQELVPASAFQSAGDATSFSLGPHEMVVYRADQDTDEKFELYAYVPLVFADGFESGNTSSWSSAAP